MLMKRNEVDWELSLSRESTNRPELAQNRVNRWALLGLGGWWCFGSGTVFADSVQARLIASIEKQVVEAPPVDKGTWFHSRACLTPDRILMTVQTIKGSDYFAVLMEIKCVLRQLETHS